MDVSIIIINFRCPELIINCLHSIYTFTKKVSFEIIIVDNDPINGDGERLRTIYPDIKCIDMDYNAGFGRANNKGMAAASGKYFLLLNADTLLTDNIIDRCFDRMNTRKDIIALGALQHYADNTPMPFYRSFNEFRRTFFILPPGNTVDKIMHRLYPDPSHKDPQQYDWLVGAFIFTRREGYEKTGGFSEDFFMYGEDVEWSWRLGLLGKLCIFDDSTYIHLENKNPFRRTHISWINRFSTQMQVSNLLWIRKQYGILAYLTLIIHYVTMIPVVYLWKIVNNLRSGSPVTELDTQHIYLRKTQVLLKYFTRTLFLKKGMYKILKKENIDLLTSSQS